MSNIYIQFIILHKCNKIKAATSPNENTLIYGCHYLNNCNGHGTCNHAKGVCECYPSWGSDDEVINILLNRRPSPDCSKRVCPIGKSWSNRIIIKSNNSSTIASQDVEEKVELHGILSECSNSGYCDRDHGLCRCYDGFRGTACEYRNLCINDCSGHGTCTSLKNIGIKSRRNYYTDNESDGDSNADISVSNRYWEYDRIFGCICDSSWVVGLGAGESQQTEWFGSDCSNRHCPSGDNPDTTIDETDCSDIIATSKVGSVIGKDGNVGSKGNLCHYDCSGKGTCDYSTGICECFEDNFGPACEFKRIR